MKAVSNKTDNKKRKRDDLQEPISESPKKAKVHAQRKFAQGAAFNSPVITPIKDKVRPTSAPTPGPMLTSKRPNTEDFLTFLCFRRTSILPPKLDFFKDALKSEQNLCTPVGKAKSGVETGRYSSKKSEKSDDGKKSQVPAVQALRRKYQEQRLAKQKVTNVTKLAQKVKGKNMVRTRSSTVIEETETSVEKQASVKDNKTKTSTGLRSGLKRVQPSSNRTAKSIVKPKHLRAGLRSSDKFVTRGNLEMKSSVSGVKKTAKESRKIRTEVSEVKTRVVKVRKAEGFSDFSSDDNDPLLAVKKPKTGGKKTGIDSAVDEYGKQDKKLVKTRSQIMNESDTGSVSVRPTRKTKEAAAIYMEMITKKLVSPDKSGDDDVSSVDSFPELPNAKRNEQRETEIRAKAMASKKGDSSKEAGEVKSKDSKKCLDKKNENVSKADLKVSREETSKKLSQNLKKDTKSHGKAENIAMKKPGRNSVKEDLVKGNPNSGESAKRLQVTVHSPGPSTRSRHFEQVEVCLKKVTGKVLSGKKPKETSNRETGKQEKPIQKKIKAKDARKEQMEENNSIVSNDSEKYEPGKDIKKGVDKKGSKVGEKKESKEKEDIAKEGNLRKGKKGLEVRLEKLFENGKGNRNKRKRANRNSESVEIGNTGSKRPTRKCSMADKILIDFDGFTSDEEDFLEISPVPKTRASTEQGVTEKQKPKSKLEKKLNKQESGTTSRNKNKKQREVEKEEKEEDKKTEKKKVKTEIKVKADETGPKSSPEMTKLETEGKLKEDVETKTVRNEDIENKEISCENLKNDQIESNNQFLQSGKKAKEILEVKQQPDSSDQKQTVGKNSQLESEKDLKALSTNKDNVQEVGRIIAEGDKEEKKQGDEIELKKSNAKEEAVEKGNKPGNEFKSSRKTSAKINKRKPDRPRNLRERGVVGREENKEVSGSRSFKRTRPVRQCSTGEKKWIETDSDSFSFYESSEDDEDNLPIIDISYKHKVKSSPVGTDTKEKKDFEEEKEFKEENGVKLSKGNIPCSVDPSSDHFSESDEEPLKKKAFVAEEVPKVEQPEIGNKSETPEMKTPVKLQRDVPGLNPLKPQWETTLKEIPSISQNAVSVDASDGQRPNLSISNEPIAVFHDAKNFEGKREVSGVRVQIPKNEVAPEPRSLIFTEETQLSSMPNRIEMILHSTKRDRIQETSPGYVNDVKVTFGNAPYHPNSHPSQFNAFSCGYQVRPMEFPPPREPISTHGLDLLSEVALPTTPKEKISSSTERIEKWLKDSLAADHKKNAFPVYNEVKYKKMERERMTKPVLEKPQLEHGVYYGKPIPGPAKVTSHPEVHKFGHAELIESQKLLKRNVFEAKHDLIRSESQTTQPKKTLTSVQDLLKLQKERKEVTKSPADNSPHLKNCKCNNCIVKKGWFKNKPVPKVNQIKSSSEQDGSAKPFESLTKAFTKISQPETKSSKKSVSVAPIVVSSTPIPSPKETGERRGIFQQRKLSFLERMKERERKEAAAAAKPSSNAFSPNNESSVYAFEPETEQPSGSTSTPFRSKTRESRTSSTNTSKSDEDVLRICEDETSTTVSSGTQVGRTIAQESKNPSKASQSASIAVQVNLDSETVTEAENATEIQDAKSIEISTQTEVPEEDSDSPMFYIPLQQANAPGTSGSSDQQMIRGVALKLGTEGPMGPNQRVIMKAKLVTKPPDTPSIKAVVMPQPKRMFDQKNNNPPIGTVQPTTRKPPEALPEGNKTEGESHRPTSGKRLASLPKSDSSGEVQVPTDSTAEPENLCSSKTNKNSPAVSQGKSSSKNKEKTVKDRPELMAEDSPSSSSSSSKSKRANKHKASESTITPTNSTWLPPAGSSKLVEAPTFHPTEKDFQDPFEFFERIRPAAEKFGLCRIVPPSNFKPDCKVSDDMRFTAYNQYVHRMFHRWGPNIKEMMAIKKYLATQSISLKQPPWIGGIEVDLPRLYQSVQNCGGLMKVMEKKKWQQVADMMKIPKAAQDRVTKLDDIYCKYLLPYDTLSHDERQKLFDEVEKDWSERQKSTENQDSQGDEDNEEENYIEECEECVVKGRNMGLNQFYRIARNTMSMWFKSPEPSPREVENEFWKHVSERNNHVCVHSGSIDSSGWGYGFPIAKNNTFSKHPWNLKVLTNNSGSVLRSLGPVMGVTVPTLHVGMVFTAFCWYRDPHGLPWIEYLHTGAPKIWYGISDDNSSVFQEALNKLLPRYMKKKTIWLPSDTAMIPPDSLVENGVSLCHTVQEPGQFILVFPRAFTSSICTGYLVSESVYFAQPSWLTTAVQVFKDIQESCEPSMFSLEKLLFSIAGDSRSSVEVLRQVLPMVWHVRQKEIDGRKTLINLGLKTSERLPAKEFGGKRKKGRWAREEDGDYECEVCRTNLYLSLVTNSHEEGVYCLHHAVEMLTQKRNQLKYCKLMYTYTQEEMNELVEKLEQKIESKSQKKVASKSSTTTK